jgi:hypothetical protein
MNTFLVIHVIAALVRPRTSKSVQTPFAIASRSIIV